MLTAYREGAFSPSSKPWLGYFMLLEKHERSVQPVNAREPHFPVFPEYKAASYKERYMMFCERLVRERLYDAACLLLSERDTGRLGMYDIPSEEIGFSNFISSLSGKVIATVQRNNDPSVF